jgi:hypothetical protein
MPGQPNERLDPTFWTLNDAEAKSNFIGFSKSGGRCKAPREGNCGNKDCAMFIIHQTLSSTKKAFLFDNKKDRS